MKVDENYNSIRVRSDDEICSIQINRPESNNSINDCLINELDQVVSACRESVKILVLEGLPEVFCFGADFEELKTNTERNGTKELQNPEQLYNLWTNIACGPFVSVAHVRGRANAGGMGFVSACNIVLSEKKAVFSLSELLFGLLPACVLPFLIRRIGFSKANYLTLSTQPIAAPQAYDWGLVDGYEEDSGALLRRHLMRLRRLSKRSIIRQKQYMNKLNDDPVLYKDQALMTNREVFSDSQNLESISRYVETGKFPWEA